MKTIQLLLGALFFLVTVNAYGEDRPLKRVEVPVDKDGVQKVEILGGGYFFDPGHIVVKNNVPVELVLTKESGFTPHNFIIKAPDAGINVSVDMDTKPASVKFTPTKPGKYAIECDKKLLFFPSHKEKGMVGVLEVTE